MTSTGMQWTVAAPFTKSVDDQWLTPFVPGDHHFEIVVRPGQQLSWHERRKELTAAREWADLVRQGRTALHRTSGGVITVFPQLAAIVGMAKRVTRKDAPVVAWFFNTNLYGGAKRVVAANGLRQVDRMVVHTSHEKEVYADWLGVDLDRFVFAPLQFGNPFEVHAEEVDDPFVFATGSGFRDYGTMFDAVGRLGHRTLIVAGPRILAGLTPPPNVEILEGVSRAEILRLSQQARVNVIPMNTEGLVAGTVTISQTLRLGRAPVITRRHGTADYIEDGMTGLYVAPADVDGMAEAIDAMWSDDDQRRRMNASALQWGIDNLTDEAAGRNLGRVLDELTGVSAVA